MIKLPDITMVYVIVAFAVSWAILKKYLFDPLSAILDAREQDEKTAAKMYAESLEGLSRTMTHAEQELSRARREALRQRETLRAEGRTVLEQRIAEAQAAAQAAIDQASREIEAEAQRLAQNLPGEARGLARELAERILGRKLAA
jgi:F-type H+-transporting ATPase subunit b